jgi:NADH dehydrogenase
MTSDEGHAANGATPVHGRIFITGGAGFVGSAIRRSLAGRPLRLLVREKSDASDLADEMTEVVEGDVTRPETLTGTMDGCGAVIHLVAIISEAGGATFDGVIHHGTRHVLAVAEAAGVKRLLHMSALGTRDDPHFGYFQAKWQAEQAVQASPIPWTIFRPSVIFGPGDEFISTLANLVKRAPVIPVVGDGSSKFQPIAVDDVADAFARALDDSATAGKTLDLGGGKIYSYEQMLDVIARELGKQKPKVHIPASLMMPVVKLSSPLPKMLRPPVTEEQLKMLAIDNCTDDSDTGELIGRPPTSLENGIGYIRGA